MRYSSAPKKLIFKRTEFELLLRKRRTWNEAIGNTYTRPVYFAF